MRYLGILLMLVSSICLAEQPKTYSCVYESYSDEKGNHKADKKFELNFIVDEESGKNYLLGNNGSSEVKLLEYSDKLTFIELTESGNIMTTTIDSSLSSVHSRNSVMFGELIPSQHYGKCKIK